MTSKRQETDAAFDAFLSGVDLALTAQHGPNHQDVLSAGRMIHQFKWSALDPLKRIDPG